MKGKFNIEATTASNHLKFSITGRIWFGEMANSLRNIVDEALAKGVTSSELLLTTPGGNVYEAIDVISELKRLPNLSIKTGSIVASAGTRILAEFENVEANKATQFMIHKPMVSLDGNEDEIEAELINLKNITSDYRKTYARKFNQKDSEIEAKWKQNYWMNAEAAQKIGLVKTITEDDIPYNESVIEMMEACGCPNIPKPKPTEPNAKNSNKNKMDINQLRAALGMPADATEEQVLARVAENKTKADNASAIEASVTKQRTEAAERVVNQAILDKKITADMKATYVALHMQDSVKTEEILAAMKGVNPASAEIIDKPDGQPNAAGRENWTLDDYLEKDPKALDVLIESDPEAVKKLNEAYASSKN
ncbi:MAG: ATP-dependent Clp protease proteolytic subunit [Bergeyella sp.]